MAANFDSFSRNSWRKKIRGLLKRIDETLIPPEAKGKGKFGTDKETCELYDDWCKRIHELNVQFKALPGSPNRADLDRKERLAQLFYLIPLRGQTTATGLAIEIVAFYSGRDVGSVKNVIKREKRRLKQDKM